MSEKQFDKMGNIPEANLIGYFRSELTKEQALDVEAWIHASEKNRLFAEDVYQIVLAQDILQTVTNISTEEALKKVNRKLVTQKIKKMGRKVQRIAAILFIPLLASFAYLFIHEMNKEPEYITFKTNPGMVVDFKLPDGSKVWLNARSELRYPSFFKGNKREVHLSGEAYFQVKQDKQHPFIVGLSNNVEIKVTGTEFNVDAYKEMSKITAMLVSGGIRVNYPNQTPEKQIVNLEPGQKIIYDKNSRKMTRLYASPLVETAWKDGKIILQNTPLEHLLHTLSKRFNVDFILENEQLKEQRFTGIFGTQSLALILKHLEVSSGIKHSMQMPEENDAEGRTRITLY